jgi:peptide chain release factor 1
MEVTGKNADKLFAHEAGGHRVQRVPPTEKRGRRHTSTITVVVLPVHQQDVAALHERDCDWQATVGSGAGGQARNKTASAVQMRHLPSGLFIRVEAERSQWLNRQTALRLLAARLAGAATDAARASQNASRRNQAGSGMRGDKRRTVRWQDDNVVDHVTGKRTTVSRYMRGFVDDLHP